MGSEGHFGFIPLCNAYEVVSVFQVDFRVYPGGPRGIEQVCDEQKWVTIFLPDFVECTESTHRQRLLSFFFMKRTRAPHGDLVGRMKPFHVCSSRNSWRAVNSGGDKEYIGL